MQTSMRVSQHNRDQLAQIAERELGGVSLDEALAVLLFEHLTNQALARLADDPAEAGAYAAEAAELAAVDSEARD